MDDEQRLELARRALRVAKQLYSTRRASGAVWSTWWTDRAISLARDLDDAAGRCVLQEAISLKGDVTKWRRYL